MKQRPFFYTALVAFAATSAVAATPASAPTPQSLTFEAAWGRLRTYSDKLAAAQSVVDQKALQREGVEGLRRPHVSLDAATFSYSATLDVSLDPVNQKLAQIEGHLPIPLANLPIPIHPLQLPALYSYTRESSATTASVSAVLPLYEGGAIDAVRSLVTAQTDEARADKLHTQYELVTLLTQRYFGSQLATKASSLRDAALRNVTQHDAAAEKMLQSGVISRIERLQVRAAFEDAKRNALKAHDDAELASVALARTLKLQDGVDAQTPLFAYSHAIGSLAYFTETALLQHPGLAKVAAKKAQAQSLHDGEEAIRKPQIFAFGQHALKEKNPDWVAGIGLRWTLYDGLDHDKLSAASAKQVEQAELTDTQARSDIALLVERNWRLVEQAQRQFHSTQTSTELALELLRLRTAAVREGTGTTLDLMDAETNAAKVQTERAQAAYEFDIALANLLESCGLSEEYAGYVARADVWMK